MKINKTFFSIAFLLLNFYAESQFYNLPSDYFFGLLTEKELAKKDSSIHSGMKPYIHFYSTKYVHVKDSHRVFKYIVEDPSIETIFYNHLIRVEPKKENFILHLDPILNVEKGIDFASKINKQPYTNTRGFIASGYIGDKVYIESMFAENQSVFQDYISDFSKTNSVVPGQGRWKKFKSNGQDYAFSSGFVSVQVFKSVNLQAGHGKHKIGNGYRSLLLSDNAFNYPFARLTQQWFKGRLQYTNIYAVLMNIKPAAEKRNLQTEALLQKKAANFQYLSLNLNKRINIGIFQGMIWQPGDVRNQQHLDWQYFNPVIGANLISDESSKINAIRFGGDLKIKITNSLNGYLQYMQEDPNHRTGRYLGYQSGINYFDAFKIKNLFLQFEWNQTLMEPPHVLLPDGFQNSSKSNYLHFNQNLAYINEIGKELLVLTDYKYKRFFMSLKYSYQEVAIRPNTRVTAYFVNSIQTRFGYTINPAYNLNVSLGFNYRNQNFHIFKNSNNESGYFFVAIKTSLYNIYTDF